MKQRLCALLGALLLLSCLTVPVLADEEPADSDAANATAETDAEADASQEPVTSLDYGDDDLFTYGYEGTYVFDPDGVLTETEADGLETQSQSIADTLNCGVYILVLEDFTLYGYDDLFEYAQDFYEEQDPGYGSDRDGVLLSLSTETRDVSLLAHGSFGNAAITDYGREEVLYDAFLDDFRNDDWYGGMVHYQEACADLLQQARNGTPVDVPQEEPATLPQVIGGAVLTGILPAAIIAFIACAIMKRGMKTAQKATNAGAYVSGAVDLKVRQDHFTHITTLRTPLPKSTPSRSGGGGGHSSGGYHGGTTVNSRGFSGSSRKF